MGESVPENRKRKGAFLIDTSELSTATKYLVYEYKGTSHKGKGVPVHAMKTCKGNGGITPFILNIGAWTILAVD
jgi:hypothetical protein